MTPPAKDNPQGPATTLEESAAERADAKEDAVLEVPLDSPDRAGEEGGQTDHAEEEEAGPPPMAQLEDLERSYGDRPALGPVTLELPRGCVGLLGPNGAGKTTLIRTLMGLLAPNNGTVRVLGEPVRAGAKEVRRRIGYLPEGEALFPGLSGVQAVVLAGRLSGMPRDAAMQRAHQVIDYVGLGEARYRLVSSYSTGMRQRLKLAQALVHDPELLILDEPTEGVDPEARKDILDLIAELKEKHGIQVLLSTHLLHDVERLADYTVVLNEGRVVVAGPLAELKKPQSPAYMVRVYGETGALQQQLEKNGVAWRHQHPGLRVELDDPRKILKHVQEAGLVIRHLAPVQLSLTDAYEEAVAQGGEPHA